MATPITIQTHIYEEQRRHSPTASGEFSWLLSGITLATKMIGWHVRRAGIERHPGLGRPDQRPGRDAAEARRARQPGTARLPGPPRQRRHHGLRGERRSRRRRARPRSAASTSSSSIRSTAPATSTSTSASARSSRSWAASPTRAAAATRCSTCCNRAASSWRPATSSTARPRCWSTRPGNGVYGFTLDPSIGAFVLSHDRITMPEHGNIYSCNEANSDSFPDGYQRFLQQLRAGELGRTYSSRYIGSLVADFHRTLLEGRHLPLSADQAIPARQAAAALRSQPDRLPGRAGRRPGDRRPTQHPRHPAHQPAPALPAGGRQPRRGGPAA